MGGFDHLAGSGGVAELEQRPADTRGSMGQPGQRPCGLDRARRYRPRPAVVAPDRLCDGPAAQPHREIAQRWTVELDGHGEKRSDRPGAPGDEVDHHIRIHRSAEALEHRDSLRFQIGALQRPADQRRSVCDADVPGIEPGSCLQRDRVEPVQGMRDPSERRVPPLTVPGLPAGLGQEERHAGAAAVQIGAEGSIGEVHLVGVVFRILGHAHPGTAVSVTEGGVAQVIRDAGSNRQRRVRIEGHRGSPSNGGKSSREPGFR